MTLSIEVIPMLRLEVLRQPVDLTNVRRLPEQLAGSASYRDGVLGIDGLAGGFLVDFRSMHLTLD